jgi:hypothetical protein
MILKPGDCLLYAPKGFFGWVISIKTWNQVAHCEVYIGNGKSVASRDGIGVGEYDLRTSELKHVMRPNQPFELRLAYDWFARKARGQGYDWLGLLRFAWRSRVVPERFDNKQFCSEFAARFYRAGGLDPFNGADADAIAPFQFAVSPYLDKYDVGINGVVTKAESERV